MHWSYSIVVLHDDFAKNYCSSIANKSALWLSLTLENARLIWGCAFTMLAMQIWVQWWLAKTMPPTQGRMEGDNKQLGWAGGGQCGRVAVVVGSPADSWHGTLAAEASLAQRLRCGHSWQPGTRLDGLVQVQDCNNSSMLAMELLQFCPKQLLQCISNGVTAVLH